MAAADDIALSNVVHALTLLQVRLEMSGKQNSTGPGTFGNL